MLGRSGLLCDVRGVGWEGVGCCVTVRGVGWEGVGCCVMLEA